MTTNSHWEKPEPYSLVLDPTALEGLPPGSQLPPSSFWGVLASSAAEARRIVEQATGVQLPVGAKTYRAEELQERGYMAARPSDATERFYAEGPFPIWNSPDKRIIAVFFDGTNNQVQPAGTDRPGSPPGTNVLRLFRALAEDSGPSQFATYIPGVGTLPSRSMRTGIGRKMRVVADWVVGSGVKEDVEVAYRYLQNCYRPGDQIILFGFSRGAYSARALAALLSQYGLARPGQQDLAKYALEYFWRGRSTAFDLFRTKKRKKCRREDAAGAARVFKESFSWDVYVHFVGLWDTVSAIGLFHRAHKIPGTTSLDRVVAAAHAVAIDERRTFFPIDLTDTDSEITQADEVRALHEDGSLEAHFSETEDPTQRYQKLLTYGRVMNQRLKVGDSQGRWVFGRRSGATLLFETAWFAGHHSDVGGTPTREQGLSNISLRWMVGKALMATDLKLDLSRIPPFRQEDALHPLNPPWKWLRVPFFFLFRGRKLNQNAHLHESVFYRYAGTEVGGKPIEESTHWRTVERYRKRQSTSPTRSWIQQYNSFFDALEEGAPERIDFDHAVGIAATSWRGDQDSYVEGKSAAPAQRDSPVTRRLWQNPCDLAFSELMGSIQQFVDQLNGLAWVPGSDEVALDSLERWLAAYIDELEGTTRFVARLGGLDIVQANWLSTKVNEPMGVRHVQVLSQKHPAAARRNGVAKGPCIYVVTGSDHLLTVTAILDAEARDIEYSRLPTVDDLQDRVASFLAGEPHLRTPLERAYRHNCQEDVLDRLWDNYWKLDARTEAARGFLVRSRERPAYWPRGI